MIESCTLVLGKEGSRYTNVSERRDRSVPCAKSLKAVCQQGDPWTPRNKSTDKLLGFQWLFASHCGTCRLPKVITTSTLLEAHCRTALAHSCP